VIIYLTDHLQITLSADTLKKLLQTFDLDRSGQIGLNEFVCLYQFVLAVRNAFFSQDHDRSGKLDTCAVSSPTRVYG
jgi:hypothetical protein